MVSISAARQYNVGGTFQRAGKADAAQGAGSFDALIGQSASRSSPDEAAAVASGEAYDFSDMTRQEIAEAGKALFQQGKITLDELFRFDHPDGILRVGTGGVTALNPGDRIDFVADTRNAIRNMEFTGEANSPGSGYEMMVGLLAKLEHAAEGR